jgi:hypothetical protein
MFGGLFFLLSPEKNKTSRPWHNGSVPHGKFKPIKIGNVS